MEENQKSCCTCSSNMKYIAIILIILGVVAIGVLSLLRERIVNPSQDRVLFSAEGRAFMRPDIAQIIVAVKTDRVKDSVKAVKQNTEQMNKVISKLKELGIEEKDIKTTAYRLNPVYDYNHETGQQTLAGYEVYQEVTVKVRNLDKVGEIIEATTKVGANQVGNIAFTIDEPEAIRKLAREEAIAKAQKKAEEIAKLTGIKLGKLVNIYENTGYIPMPYDYTAQSMKLGIGGGGAAPEIQTGENEVRLEVTLVYEVR